MSEIPCKNCIVFVMCKSQVVAYKNKLSLYGIYDCILRTKCSIIKDWVNESSSFPAIQQVRLGRLREIYKLFLQSKDLMSEMPCKNCITLPMCKAQATEYMCEYKNMLGVGLYGMYDAVLKSKCIIIQKWLSEDVSIKEKNIRFNNIYKLFVDYIAVEELNHE